VASLASEKTTHHRAGVRTPQLPLNTGTPAHLLEEQTKTKTSECSLAGRSNSEQGVLPTSIIGGKRDWTDSPRTGKGGRRGHWGGERKVPKEL